MANKIDKEAIAWARSRMDAEKFVDMTSYTRGAILEPWEYVIRRVPEAS